MSMDNMNLICSRCVDSHISIFCFYKWILHDICIHQNIYKVSNE
jgi:hypothetical protein